MYINQIITGLFSIMLLMIGLDKFLVFLEQCSLFSSINPTTLKVIGITQILMGISVWNVKWRSSVAWLILGLMVYFIIRHIVEGTYDIGGAVFMALISILIIWDPFKPKNN